MSAGKVTSSVLTVLQFGTQNALIVKCEEASDKRLMRVNLCQSLQYDIACNVCLRLLPNFCL